MVGTRDDSVLTTRLLMNDLRRDLRQAMRSARRQPSFTLTVVLTIALGVGASTAMFSVLNAVLLSPLPQRNADRVVRLYQPNTSSETTGLSPLEIADYREQARALEDVVEYHSMPFTFIGTTEAQRLQTGVVSANFFDALGLHPVLGRSFRPDEDQPGADPVLLLSYEYWQREHGGSANVVGSTLRMNDRTHRVIGVLPPHPQYPDENDVYMPTSSCPFRSAPGWAEDRQARGTAAFALVRQGVTPDALDAELRTVAARLHAGHADAYPPDRRFDIRAMPIEELIASPARATLVLLLAATVLLLLIVCSNVGNLMIVRMLRRGEEMAVRTAFGATRARLARQLLTESVLLSAAGGTLGLLVAYASVGLLARFVGRFTPRASEIGVDGTVLLFAIGATALAAVVSGLLPLTALRPGVATVLRSSSGRAGTSGTHARVRDGLILLQVCVSLLLLVGTGLLLRTVTHLQAMDTGFDARGVMTARLDLNWTRYQGSDERLRFFGELERELLARPGVRAVGVGSILPLSGQSAFGVQVTTEERVLAGEGPTGARATTASAGWFAALGVPLLRGRTFGTQDEGENAERVAIVTRSFAERHWPGADPVGRRTSFDGGESWARVVGEVGDVRLGLEHDSENLVFVPHHQGGGIEARVLVRGDAPRAALERALRETVSAIDARQPVTDVRSFDAHRGERLSPYRLTTLLMGLFAAVALGVTAVGLGGVIAHSIAQRTREIGIRIAIGARQAAVLRMVLGRTLALVGLGAMLGIGAAWLLADSMSALVIGVAVADPLAFAGAVLLLLTVATLAGLVPARRAVRTDPLQVLR